ncbi:helix-turn-helix domain-containing protein [Psychroserpens sp. Hel_I_66]|uniref:helix-turn-helix domain-containing protein n=1 Tax=Psychroserpens sp. Hel_I_66 TaxID=1250004 RepID=UPI00064781D7|nr:AraC family transcriptional regulator [Psychroserpens sp. Hel_I_66]
MRIQVKFDVPKICNSLLIKTLSDLNIKYKLHTIGEIEILQRLNDSQKKSIFEALNSNHIQVISDQQLVIVQQVKEILTEIVRIENFEDDFKVSSYIENRLPYTYSYLAKMFSEHANISIEKFLILKKIDFVKELLLEGNLSLTEISYKLNYSSVSHLSKQFKKTTGFSPSGFMDLKTKLNLKK